MKEKTSVEKQEELRNLLKSSRAGSQVYYFDALDSTNLEAKRLGEQGAPHGTLVVSDMQSAGRGRRGRNWSSPAGSNIYMSILLRPEFSPELAPMLTLVMACGTVRAIREMTGLDARIKWPNDLVIGGRKVCGILTEMSTAVRSNAGADSDASKTREDGIRYVVIGTGINVNVSRFPEELRELATSLKMEAGQAFERKSLVVNILECFEKDYEVFLERQDLSGLRDEYNRLLVNRDRKVRVLDGKNSYNGTARGINDRGELLVSREDGRVETVCSGEVSVRGIYGYV